MTVTRPVSVNFAPTIVIVIPAVSTPIVTVRTVVAPVTKSPAMIRQLRMTTGREEVTIWRNAGENFAVPTMRSTINGPTTPDLPYLVITDGVGEA